MQPYSIVVLRGITTLAPSCGGSEGYVEGVRDAYGAIQARYDRLEGMQLEQLEDRRGREARPFDSATPPEWAVYGLRSSVYADGFLDGETGEVWSLFGPAEGSRTLVFDYAWRPRSRILNPAKSAALQIWAIDLLRLRQMQRQGIVPVNPALLNASPPSIEESHVIGGGLLKPCRLFVIEGNRGTIRDARADDVEIWKSTSFSDYSDQTGCSERIDTKLAAAGLYRPQRFVVGRRSFVQSASDPASFLTSSGPLTATVAS